MVSIKPYTLLYRFINPLKHIVCGEVKTIFPSGFRSWSSAAGMVKARKFILAKHFVGEPKESDFQLVEEDLPELKNGEVLVEAEWLSVDPYMRPYTMWLPTGITMIGGQVARVVRSRDPAVPEGSRVMGYFGWRDRTVVDLSQPNSLPMPDKPYLLPDFQGLPPSLGVGVLGMPGLTALYGVREVLRPTPGGVVVVSGAAGAVGSLVGQIAKHAGCKVIGFAGSDAKVRWLKDELGFNEAFNYKSTDVTTALKSAAPEGVDCYFDNVGGEMSSAVLNRMNHGGRVAVCGSTSTYNASGKGRLPLAGPHLQGAADGGLHGAAVERPLAGGRPRDAAARQAGQAEVPRNGHPRF
ncbi:prostaglandin reductase 1-like isoform X2 [Bacillus rossius redtenbacheri]|uniref:prostaglandin reductase 1-like isoform X2 n=1 Tax=Bacillus rossius redtenbacheri TaxID=93214 RepID=UPI002FDE13CC